MNTKEENHLVLLQLFICSYMIGVDPPTQIVRVSLALQRVERQ